MVKKLKLKEGTVFAIPLKHEGYGIGLISKKYRNIAVGYFFKNIYKEIPVQVPEFIFKKNNISLVARFSVIGIEIGEWPIVESKFCFDSAEWPMPTFKMQDPITEKYYAVTYDETLLNEKKYRITDQEEKKLFSDGLFGSGALEKKLSMLLSELAN